MRKLFLLLALSSIFVLSVNADNKKQKKSEIIATAVAKKMLDKNLVIYITNVMSDMGNSSI